jgi:hypothetical protein
MKAKKHNAPFVTDAWFPETKVVNSKKKSLTDKQKLVIIYALQFLSSNLEYEITLENGEELMPDEVREIIENIKL